MLAQKTIIGAGNHAAHEYAEVAIISGLTIHLFSRLGDAHIANDGTTFLACPTIDITNLDADLDEKVAEITGAYKHTRELPELLEGLSNLGATVTETPCALCVCTPMTCITCTFGGLK